MATAATKRPKPLSQDQILDGGDVLPGFKLSLAQLFVDLEESRAKPVNGKRKKKS